MFVGFLLWGVLVFFGFFFSSALLLMDTISWECFNSLVFFNAMFDEAVKYKEENLCVCLAKLEIQQPSKLQKEKA